MHFFRLLHNNSEVFTASPLRLREQERYEAFGFASKIVALQVHRTLWYISLRCHYHHGRRRYLPNHNCNKIVKSDWLSTALISTLIGQFNRTVRVMPK